MKKPFIIIAIIFKDLRTDFILETIQNCLHVEYPHYAVYLFPDGEITPPFKNKKMMIFPTGEANIPAKRNMALKRAANNADFIAFIDADASPRVDWLNNAIKYFAESAIVAVGGPNITPENESVARKISGYVMQQKICFGGGALRHNICESQYVDELPTCNLILRSSYAKYNLFNESYVNAEDMKYCSDIKAQGLKIFYAHDVIVYHHRKKLMLPLARQFYNYGYYRGKSFFNTPSGSKHFVIPTLFLLYIMTSAVAGVFCNTIGIILTGSLILYFAVCLCSSLLTAKNIMYGVFVSAAIFICHVSYGSGFLVYYVTGKIKHFFYRKAAADENKN
jgi:cellulose synthase/poly-beta-1,6-N-acetylglucosamine synthase-like glycosyltransferase